MRIKSINLFRAVLAFGKTQIVGLQLLDHIHSVLVQLESDSGHSGWSEVCPLGSTYLPQHAAGAEAALCEIAPKLIGFELDHPFQLEEKTRTLLRGHEYAKSGLDMACWDMLARSQNRPLYALLGGRQQDRVPGYAVMKYKDIGELPANIEQARKQGYHNFQLKVGRSGNIIEDIDAIRIVDKHRLEGETIVVDPNKWWNPSHGLQVLNQVTDICFYIEQPCETYEECLDISRKTHQPMFLDESMITIQDLLRAIKDNAMQGIVCKISRVGGLSKAMLMRDICLATGKIMRMEDNGGATSPLPLMPIWL
jgi:L-alanine-DL-glutamate epimerase-like enolase superfamily enzyme